MDIYSFINSRDIAEHCRKIGHTWNPLEMAAIIDMSHRTVEERHKAWHKLMSDYPDMPVPETNDHDGYPSLHMESQP